MSDQMTEEKIELVPARVIAVVLRVLALGQVPPPFRVDGENIELLVPGTVGPIDELVSLGKDEEVCDEVDEPVRADPGEVLEDRRPFGRDGRSGEVRRKHVVVVRGRCLNDLDRSLLRHWYPPVLRPHFATFLSR